MPFVTTFERLATERALKQGVEQGRRTAMRETLSRQLPRRFSPLPATVNDALDAAALDVLMVWSDRVIDAPTLDAVLSPPAPTEN